MSELRFPVDFEEKAKMPPSANGAGYPYRISARDLMSNYKYAALEVEDDWIEETGGSTPGRKLKLPEFPGGEGIFVLGIENGEVKWIQTDNC